MSISRRQALGLGIAGAAGIAAQGCGPMGRFLIGEKEQDLGIPTAKTPVDSLLNRATFGPTLEERLHGQQKGYEATLESLLANEQPETAYLQLALSRCETQRLDPLELMDLTKASVVEDAQKVVLLRAAYGKNGLREKMAEFWRDHFNLFGGKGDVAFLLAKADEDLRPHVLGNFRDLLRASSHNAAMLVYLDNPSNFVKHPNENYAREILELHTLGVGGGYTQKDVMELARILTGWTWERRFLRFNKGKFKVEPTQHDKGRKELLGHVFEAGGGPDEMEKVLEILTLHPSTAKYLCSKLCTKFLGHAEPEVIEAAAQKYLESKGEIKPALRVILSEQSLSTAKPLGKRPIDYVVGAVRQTGAITRFDRPVLLKLKTMGQLPYDWPMPNGYPLDPSFWVGSLLDRWNFAYEFSTNKIRGIDLDLASELKRVNAASATDSVTALTFGEALKSGPLHDVTKTATPEKALALCLASPAYQWMV